MKFNQVSPIDFNSMLASSVCIIAFGMWDWFVLHWSSLLIYLVLLNYNPRSSEVTGFLPVDEFMHVCAMYAQLKLHLLVCMAYTICQLALIRRERKLTSPRRTGFSRLCIACWSCGENEKKLRFEQHVFHLFGFASPYLQRLLQL